MNKTAVMIGAGNIGRGFVGAAFAASGFETVFIDVDERLVAEINARGEYPVRILLPEGGHTETMARGVRAVSGNDLEAAAGEIARAELCATAVGARALPHIAPLLAAGLAKRVQEQATGIPKGHTAVPAAQQTTEIPKGHTAVPVAQQTTEIPKEHTAVLVAQQTTETVPAAQKPLNIIVCENLIDAGGKLRELVLGSVSQMAAPELDAIAGFPEAVIGRMVPVQTDEMKDGDPLRVCVESYAFLPVDKAAFKGEIPLVEGMVPLDGFEYYVKRKLFVHNLGHAAIAYLGMLKGYTYIAEAVDDPDILFLAANAMRESAEALGRENPGDEANLNRHIESLLYRFTNRALGDTCARVGADPLRKLGAEDRLIGALRNCERYGLPTVYIAAAAAAAMLTLEKTLSESEYLPSLSTVTGLPSESEAHRTIMTLGSVCAAAAPDDADGGVAALRRAAMKLAGDIRVM